MDRQDTSFSTTSAFESLSPTAAKKLAKVVQWSDHVGVRLDTPLGTVFVQYTGADWRGSSYVSKRNPSTGGRWVEGRLSESDVLGLVSDYDASLIPLDVHPST